MNCCFRNTTELSGAELIVLLYFCFQGEGGKPGERGVMGPTGPTVSVFFVMLCLILQCFINYRW